MDFGMCILVAFATFELLTEKWEEIKTAEDIIARNKSLIDTVSNADHAQSILMDLPYHIECIEQCIIQNRKDGLFLPKRVRNMFINYYSELDSIKHLYLDDETTTFPHSSAEIEIYTEDESQTHSLQKLQNRLNGILEDVVTCLENNSIPYYLDRGSLLGAIRVPENAAGGFLFWDDMINITIPRHCEEKAKQALTAAFPNKYSVQDISSEPLLANKRYSFRVREKNHLSRIHTKELVDPLFAERGIFITINTIGPIIAGPKIDPLVRRHLFHPLLGKIRKSRMRVYQALLADDGSLSRVLQKHSRLTKKYGKRLQLYDRWAKNEDILCYTPGNIQQYAWYEIERNFRQKVLKQDLAASERKMITKRMWRIRIHTKPQYIRRTNIFGSTTRKPFMGKYYTVPSDCNTYLTVLYGKQWHRSPFATKEMLKKQYGDSNWYSKANLFQVSCLRHTRHIDFFKESI
jgi:phosphorylcholine metabolism protein LicD